MRRVIKSLLTIAFSAALSAITFINAAKADDGNFVGNLRLGYIHSADDDGNNAASSAFGGKLGYVSSHWQALSAGGTVYATQKMFNDDNGDFFGSDGQSYAILGEAFIQANLANTNIVAGRFEFDSPFADTDDIRMMPNTFSGVAIANTDIASTKIYAVYFEQWSGVDSDVPEDFTDLNGDDGLYTAGAIFEADNGLAIQAWYYLGRNYANFSYAEAMFEFGNFVVGAQFASQSDDTADGSGPDGDVYGILASYNFIANVTVTAAYNEVSGTVVNGFGGGPFFTSSGDHTIINSQDQNAMAVGIDYEGIDNLTLSILHVTFDKGADETDVTAAYEFSDIMSLVAAYHHMYEDGEMLLIRFNVGF